MKKYKALFEQLKPCKGRVSKATLAQAELEYEVEEIIRPILDELNMSDAQLSFEEFCGAMDALLDYVSPEARRKLLYATKSSLATRRSLSQHSLGNLCERLASYKQSLEIAVEGVVQTPQGRSGSVR